ncbi:ABC transporter [Nonomuraea deserti]|uniref:ABC transporter n=1 Tax=Nonomuraea deserti TaxID=1848322 RepID=A0A4R4VCT5_9ACTN|nr:AAA family ATPase [Nonomuraea deserti]TDC99783.1 ABC transporter [Nonomuraea deserti]
MLLTRLSVRDPLTGWPAGLPPVRHLAEHGLRFSAPVTFLVGENGSGKSTIIEAIADACKVNSEGGKAGTRYANTGPATALGEALDAEFTAEGLRLTRGPRLKRRSFFFRAETLINLGRAVSGLPGYWTEHPDRQSHGEGFLTVLESMVSGPGIYLMDEPEAALSFTSCLRLMGLMDRAAAKGAQIICATHSPILSGLPGAQILELGDDGIHPVEWDELQVVDHFRRYLAKPGFYLRYALDE